MAKSIMRKEHRKDKIVGKETITRKREQRTDNVGNTDFSIHRACHMNECLLIGLE